MSLNARVLRNRRHIYASVDSIVIGNVIDITLYVACGLSKVKSLLEKKNSSSYLSSLSFLWPSFSLSVP